MNEFWMLVHELKKQSCGLKIAWVRSSKSTEKTSSGNWKLETGNWKLIALL